MIDGQKTTVPMRVHCLGTVTFTYRNHRGEVAQRRAIFHAMSFGTTEWHPEPQWLVEATCLDRGGRRLFALRDMTDVSYEA